MNKQSLMSLFVVLGIFFGCEDTINQQQEPLTYHGVEVLETTPAFIFPGNRVLAKGSAPKAQIEANPPYGTVYGHESDPSSVYLALGGELLPDGSWIDQIYEDLYETTLYNNSAISFESPATITITGAAQCKYLNVDDQWVPIQGDATVTVKAVSTGPNGTSTIETDSKVLMGHGGDNG